MTAPAPAETTYRVGPLTLLCEQRRLLGPHGHLTLRRQAYRLLERLMRQPNTIVSKGDLIYAIWSEHLEDEPEGAENCLKQLVWGAQNIIRALGPEGRRTIEFVRGHGYRINGDRR